MKSPLGLQHDTVRLEPYNPEWQKLFEAEKSALKKVLGDNFIAAEHVGSTAIPGIKAKPILDLMLAIPDLENWEWVQEPLSKLDYEFRRDFRKEQGHILFMKGSEENRTHYLKITEPNSDFWTEHILFRDYLINNPQYREEYQKLKENLFDAHTGNREPYTRGKEEFVRKILKLAGFNGKNTMSDVIIGKGDLAGRGVYAARDFKKNEVVIKYNLKPLTKQEFENLPQSEKEFVHTHRGIIHLYSEPERYINHSEKPNTYQDLTNWCDVALRDIQKGEMITTDATKDDIE